MVADLEMSVRQLEEGLTSLSGELGTKLLSKLTASEQRELQTLNADLAALKKDEAEQRKNRSEIEAQKKH